MWPRARSLPLAAVWLVCLCLRMQSPVARLALTPRTASTAPPGAPLLSHVAPQPQHGRLPLLSHVAPQPQHGRLRSCVYLLASQFFPSHRLPPCSPQGHYCTGGTSATPCGDDKYNPFLGASAVGACLTCDATLSPRFTSVAGSAYCTVPYFERNCPSELAGRGVCQLALPLSLQSAVPALACLQGASLFTETNTSSTSFAAAGGEYFDESSMKCEKCPAGTARTGGDATNLECTPW